MSRLGLLLVVLKVHWTREASSHDIDIDRIEIKRMEVKELLYPERLKVLRLLYVALTNLRQEYIDSRQFPSFISGR